MKKFGILLVPFLDRQEKGLFCKPARNLNSHFLNKKHLFVAANFDLRIYTMIFNPFHTFALFKRYTNSVGTAQKTHNCCNTYTNPLILFTNIFIFIITNTMHTIGVDKITLFKTT